MSRKRKKSSKATNSVLGTTVKNNKAANDKLAAKKAAVLGTEKKRFLPLFVILIGVVLIGGGVFILYQNTNSGNNYTLPVQASVETGQPVSELIYPVSLFEDGNARHFEYKGPGITIKYFILKSSDGVIRAAFDACDVCWRAGKGYYQVGDYMICRNCGQKFASIKVNEVKGGCNPSPLKRSIKGDNLVIRTNYILEGAQYFNFI